MSQPYFHGTGMMHTQMFNSQAPIVLPRTHVDWENEFSKLSELTSKEKGKGRLIEVDDEGRALDSLEEAFKSASLQQDGSEEVEKGDVGDVGDYMESFEKYVTEDILAENYNHSHSSEFGKR